jgi:hypothetical protein
LSAQKFLDGMALTRSDERAMAKEGSTESSVQKGPYGAIWIETKKSPEEAIARYTRCNWLGVFTTVFTGVLAIVAIIQIWFLMRADWTARDAANAAKVSATAAEEAAKIARKTLIAGQRAWVRIDEIGLGGGALALDQNGASVAISFKITNTGNSPALNITPNARLVIAAPDVFPWREQQKLCDEARARQFGLGFALFPTEQFPANIGFGTWSLGVNATREEVERGLQISRDKKHIMLVVVGCIDYTFPTDPAVHHQTWFMRDLRKRTPELISPDDGMIPVDQLFLEESGIGSGQYAD